jgi:hypothetical protein
MADRLSLGGFGFNSQMCNILVSNLAKFELQFQTKLFYDTIAPTHLSIRS